MRDAEEHTLHLVHPTPVPCSNILGHVGAELQLPVVAYDKWMNLLDKSAKTLAPETEEGLYRKMPALKILPFFRGALTAPEKSGEAMALPILSTDKAVLKSLRLRDSAPLDAADVSRWLSYWKGLHFIP